MNKHITLYGDFLCYNCGTITKSKIDNIDINDLDMVVEHLGVTCPTCGIKVMQYIPASMKNGLYTLASKGYKISNIQEKTVGIIFNHSADEVNFMNAIQSVPLPYEFVLDATGDGGVSLANERICYQDFTGLDKDQYYKEALENFTDWTTTLPLLKDDTLIDLTNNDNLSPVVVDGMIDISNIEEDK